MGVASIAVALLLAVATVANGQQCVDEHGKDVDWFVLYKLPKAKSKGSSSPADNGHGYAFMTSKTADSGWTLSSLSIGDPLSIPGRTLKPMYDDKSKALFYGLYNDEHPDGKTTSNEGHTKGVVVFGQKQGFWMIHSVPRYPPDRKGKYSYPETGLKNGQSFLCMSLETGKSADAVGEQLSFNDPFWYDTNVPQFVRQSYQKLAASTGRNHITKPPFNSSLKIKDGFTSYAKYKKFGKDLYEDLVAPSLQADLFAETWPNGNDRMTSNCTLKFHVQNVVEMDFTKLYPSSTFSRTVDHSKWAISQSDKNPYVCVGDINRMQSQTRRSGGTVCFSNAKVWKAFKDSVKDVEPCRIKAKNKSKNKSKNRNKKKNRKPDYNYY